jgi:hypothetical protein
VGILLQCFWYSYEHFLPDELEAELGTRIEIDKRTRIKITMKNIGRFLFGGRRAPPWSGYTTTKSAVGCGGGLRGLRTATAVGPKVCGRHRYEGHLRRALR